MANVAKTNAANDLLREVLGVEKSKALRSAIVKQHPDNMQMVMDSIAEAFADQIEMSMRMARIILDTSRTVNDGKTPFRSDSTLTELHSLAKLVGEPIAKAECSILRKRLGELIAMKLRLKELSELFSDVKPSSQLQSEIEEVEGRIKRLERDYPELSREEEK